MYAIVPRAYDVKHDTALRESRSHEQIDISYKLHDTQQKKNFCETCKLERLVLIVVGCVRHISYP